MKEHYNPYLSEAETQSETAGELTFRDVWGPAQVQSISGSKYYTSFTDDVFHCCNVYFMKKKSETFQNLKVHVTYIKRKFSLKPRSFVWTVANERLLDVSGYFIGS